MLACTCCDPPFHTKSERTMRDHKKKMRDAGKDAPKSKPGRKAIKKEPKFVVERVVRKRIVDHFEIIEVSWADAVDEMATEHYGKPVDDAQYDPNDLTDEEGFYTGGLYNLFNLREAIN